MKNSMCGRLIKNNKGMTLIELMVAMAISMIVLGCIVGIFVTGNNVVKGTNYRYDEHTMALQLEQRIENTLHNAKSLTVYDDTSSLASAADGYVYFGTDPLTAAAAPDIRGLVARQSAAATAATFMKGGYKGYGVAVTFKKTGMRVLTVTVTVTNSAGSGDSYTLTSDIAINNIGTGVSGSDAAIVDSTTNSSHTGTLVGFTQYQAP